MRIRLAQALVEIGGTSALGFLRHLANDGDPAVALIASAFVGTMDPSVRTCAETRRSAPNPLVKVGDGHGARWTRPSPWPALTEVHVRRWTNRRWSQNPPVGPPDHRIRGIQPWNDDSVSIRRRARQRAEEQAGGTPAGIFRAVGGVLGGGGGTPSPRRRRERDAARCRRPVVRARGDDRRGVLGSVVGGERCLVRRGGTSLQARREIGLADSEAATVSRTRAGPGRGSRPDGPGVGPRTGRWRCGG